MIHRIRKHTISVKHAWDGISWAFGTQPNYYIHISLSLLALLGGVMLDISYIEYLIIIVLITMGLTIETINTAIEQVSDAVTQEWNQEIKRAKDLAAGAMLLFAFGAAIIAGIIFLPRIMAVFSISL